MESAKVELSRIVVAFSTLPQDLKEAFANFQQLEEQLLLEEQSQLRTVESKTVAVLEYTDSRISDHDAKIHAVAKVISSLDEKLAKFEEQQDNVLKVLQSIDHTISELNARKGKVSPIHPESLLKEVQVKNRKLGDQSTSHLEYHLQDLSTSIGTRFLSVLLLYLIFLFCTLFSLLTTVVVSYKKYQ
ncbi:hypothetical protein OROMI_005996 [Orobanche minor]